MNIGEIFFSLLKGFYFSEITSLFIKSGVNLEEKMEEAISSGNTVHIEEASLSRFTYEIFILPVKNSSGISSGAIILHDITYRKEIERMESEFISIASHQLRTPLTGIQWVVERFIKKEHPSEKGKEYLSDIHESVKRLSSLVDTLLNVSRIQGGHVGIIPREIEIVVFIEEFLQEFTPLCMKKKLTVHFDKKPKVLKTITDHGALRNIVQSIISNAIEYTPEGGTIDVMLEKKKDSFLFTVRDTGIGIPKEDHAHIFEKFVRASNAKSVKTDGTGLGAFIAKQAVDLLGGKIWFESPYFVETSKGKEERQGTTFYVELPLEIKEKEGGKPFA